MQKYNKVKEGLEMGFIDPQVKLDRTEYLV